MHAFLKMRGAGAAIIVLACGASSAFAGWSSDPVTITSTSASIPLVEGCSDGAYGTFVAWQEESSAGQGTLRAQHLLPTGDLDPAWPKSGAIACSVVVPRTELVALPDRLGGVYLLWKEGAALYATRLEGGGIVAAGWPQRGRALGRGGQPSVIEDGVNGFYAAWMTWTGSSYVVTGVHLDPANTGAGGWPNGTRTISSLDPQRWLVIWPQLAAAPDGGAYVAWATFGFDASKGLIPGAWKLKRLTPAGLTAAAWPDGGLDFGDFHCEYIGDLPGANSLLALSEDGRGGAFLMIGNPTGSGRQGATLETRLFRLQGDGQSAIDWHGGGVVVPGAPEIYDRYEGSDGSYRLMSDHRDGVLVGALAYASDNGTSMVFQRCSADVRFDGAAGAWPLDGYEIVSRGDGGFFLADFHCCGPFGYFSPDAFIRVSHFPKALAFVEWHSDYGTQFFGDIGLAPTEDGGAVFFWSQVRERVGLFARRFSPAGEVTWVKRRVRPFPRPSLELLRFVPGEGVHAAISAPESGAARFELFDLAGRRVASVAIEPGDREMTIAGTGMLPAGLYFGRLVAGAHQTAAKLIVAR